MCFDLGSFQGQGECRCRRDILVADIHGVHILQLIRYKPIKYAKYNIEEISNNETNIPAIANMYGDVVLAISNFDVHGFFVNSEIEVKC
uniref:MMS1_N domain-containing protein n=1 Tax=Steinernema glaseri TaxID=37863 RepID=A0A1I7XWR4_9BILA